jgi:pseudouridine synthase
LDLVPEVRERIYPVGRLDYDSEGLVFLTNDGKLAYRVMHPKFELPKTYMVRVQGKISMDAVYRLRTGVILEDGLTAPAQVELVKSDQETSVLKITITEGRNRQIRRMCSSVGYNVLRLTRIAMGPLSIAGLSAGKYRFLRPKEVQELYKAVRL